MSKEALRLATRYAGYTSIQTQVVDGLENLALARDAALAAAEHMKMDCTELEAALDLIKKVMDEQVKATRKEINFIRVELEEA